MLAGLSCLVACGGNDKVVSPGDSSSAGSSSSGAGSSSSFVVPDDGSRAATMADIPTVVQFPDEAGYSVKYVFDDSLSSGVYSKLFYKGTTLAVHAAGTYSLASNGQMTLEKGDCMGQVLDTKILCPENDLTYHPQALGFVVKDDTLMAGPSAEALVAVTAATWVSPPVGLHKGSDVVGAWQKIVMGKTVNYEFYPNMRYVTVTQTSADTIIETGVFDIQADRLLLSVNFSNGDYYPASFFSAAKVTGNLLVTSPRTGVTETLIPNGDLPASLDVASLLGLWEADKGTSHKFQLNFLAEGLLTMNAWGVAPPEMAYSDEGVYDVIGPWLVLDFNAGAGCNGNGTLGIMNVTGTQPLCYGLILNTADLQSDTLNFSNEFIPTQWTRVVP